MRVGILGSGLLGGKLGTILARAGHEVIFSYALQGQTRETVARRNAGRGREGSRYRLSDRPFGIRSLRPLSPTR